MIPVQNRRAFLLLCAVIATALLWQCIGAWQDSQTTDEGVHLTSGRVYWQTGDFSLNPEHPPLFKLWASLPLLLMPQTTVETNNQIWREQNQWSIAQQYLYRSPAAQHYGAQLLMFVGRLPMILVWLGLILTVAVIAWRQWGAWPAVAGTTALAYDPTWLGHGHLVTNDVATAFTFLGTVFTLRWLLRQWSWRRAWVFGFVFALAQLTKFSTAMLWVLVPFLILVHGLLTDRSTWWPKLWRTLLISFAATVLVAWAAYGFRWTTITSDPRIGQLWAERADLVARDALWTVPPYTRLFVHLTDVQHWYGQLLDHLQHWTVPAYWYWRGFFSAASHNVYGHAAFLLGQASEHGWWYYFPVSLSVKVPILTLFALVLITLHNGLTWWRGRRWSTFISSDGLFFVLPPVAFLVWSMTSHINIGIRHIFPTYVFIPFAVAACIAVIQQRAARWASVSSMAVVVIIITTTTLAWPHTLGYFNVLAGGTSGGHNVLLDSNLDWNQDIWRLKDWLATHEADDIQLALFGSLPYADLFPGYGAVPQDDQIAAGLQPSGTIIISDGILYDVHGHHHWLQSLTPTTTIGTSIKVFTFR